MAPGTFLRVATPSPSAQIPTCASSSIRSAPAPMEPSPAPKTPARQRSTRDARTGSEQLDPTERIDSHPLTPYRQHVNSNPPCPRCGIALIVRKQQSQALGLFFRLFAVE